MRSLFTRAHLEGSDWYGARLDTKQKNETRLWTHHVQSLEAVLDQDHYADVIERLGLKARLSKAKAELERVQSVAYRQSLDGTLGVHPLV